MKHAMLHKLILFGIFCINTAVLADANDGEYLGFKLGEKFAVPPGAVGMNHVMGAMIYTVNPGQHPHHIDSISIFVSPESSIVGSIFGEWYFSNPRAANVFANRYLSNLELKYSHWVHRGRSLTYGDYQLWVEIEEKPLIVDDWPSDKNSRVAIGLIYARDSLGRNEWMALINSEIGKIKFAASD
ncbi:MAG: hypothetical protein IID58_14215 [Proteobacteria bacterium]|nr:hypothetical protein [Pseudomonadota bacterium]